MNNWGTVPIFIRRKSGQSPSYSFADPSSLLKKGDWLRADSVNTAKNGCREVPVPLFQQAARETIAGPFLKLCDLHSMPAKACKANLLTTP
jgi:hypothetical protein